MPIQQPGSIELAHVEAGTVAPPLVLLHGFPLDGWIWHRQLTGLGARRVIVPDLRGFGRSPVSPGRYTIDDLADDVAALLDRLGVEAAVVAGLSMGGYVALAFAERHRLRLAGLILVGTRAGADDAATRAARDGAIETIHSEGSDKVFRGMSDRLWAPGADPALREEVESRAAAISDSALVHALHAMRDRPDRRPLLPGLSGTPTLVIAGDLDAMIPPAAAREMAAAIPGARLVMVAGAGHLPTVERPEVVNAAIRDWLVGEV